MTYKVVLMTKGSYRASAVYPEPLDDRELAEVLVLELNEPLIKQGDEEHRWIILGKQTTPVVQGMEIVTIVPAIPPSELKLGSGAAEALAFVCRLDKR